MRIMMNNVIYFAKTKPGAKIPTKSKENMGYDIYACVENDIIEIEPHETVMIPTGIASACTPKYGFILKERGSTGTKGMAQRCGVIDSGYRGEWFIPITNTTNKKLVYPTSKAICQALLIEVPDVDCNELSYEDLCKIDSERGMGCLGASGK